MLAGGARRRCLKRANERHSTPIPAATTAASGFLLFATVNECPPTAHIANGSWVTPKK
jgi:hypothetical protein